MALGAGLAALTRDIIRSYGQPLVVTRLGRAQDITVYFQVDPMEQTTDENIRIEGAVNTGAPQRYQFVCDANADVLENDRVTYNGFTYTFATVAPTPLSGNNLSKQCVGVRTK